MKLELMSETLMETVIVRLDLLVDSVKSVMMATLEMSVTYAKAT